MYRIFDVSLSKQIVNTGEQFTISVSILTWDYIAKNFTWQSLYNKSKWGDLIEH